MKMRIFVDMDGTLANFHSEVKYLERMFEKGFFENLKPYANMIDTVNRLLDEPYNYEVFILSACVDGEPPYCIKCRDNHQVKMTTIRDALSTFNNTFEVVVTREYGQGKSAGLAIKDIVTGDKIVSIDIDIKPISDYKTYYYGEASINGVLVNQILADKLCTISSDAVYKHRVKDVIDVYALSRCIEINAKDIIDTCKRSGREIQTFDSLFNKTKEIEHAYDKLKGIENKPLFSEVFPFICKFVKPFINKDLTNAIWNPTSYAWEEKNNIEENTFSYEDLEP